MNFLGGASGKTKCKLLRDVLETEQRSINNSIASDISIIHVHMMDHEKHNLQDYGPLNVRRAKTL